MKQLANPPAMEALGVKAHGFGMGTGVWRRYPSFCCMFCLSVKVFNVFVYFCFICLTSYLL